MIMATEYYYHRQHPISSHEATQHVQHSTWREAATGYCTCCHCLLQYDNRVHTMNTIHRTRAGWACSYLMQPPCVLRFTMIDLILLFNHLPYQFLSVSYSCPSHFLPFLIPSSCQLALFHIWSLLPINPFHSVSAQIIHQLDPSTQAPPTSSSRNVLPYASLTCAISRLYIQHAGLSLVSPSTRHSLSAGKINASGALIAP